MKYALSFLLLVCISSCSFNRKFYQPDKLNKDLRLITIANKESNDTVLLHFEGDGHRAYFTDNNDNPKILVMRSKQYHSPVPTAKNYTVGS